jgi:hypothetical protein
MNRISIKKVYDDPVPPDAGSPKRASVLPKILDRLEDAEASPFEIIRLISVEIAGIVDAMQRNDEIGTPKSASKSALEQVKALRLLSRTLVESYVPDSRDVLNIRGPKFQYVFFRIHGCLREALEHATKKPLGEFVNAMILREFKDRVVMNEQDMQREIDKPDFSYVFEPKVPDR